MGNTSEEKKEILLSLKDYIENCNLNEIDKFVLKQNCQNEIDKSFKEWEKIKMNIFS